MSPTRSFVPLFLISSLFVLFLFSLYRSPLPLSSVPHSSVTSSQTFNHPVSPLEFTFTVKVLAFDRIASLSRCLDSLARADYGTDRVHLHIFIDHLKNVSSTGNASLDLDVKLNESRQILDFVDGFSWRFGEKVVHYRTGNVGLQAQWLEAWWPSSDNEFAFVVEDDLEVSPMYYRFLRGLIAHYYYNASNFSPSIYGISLQRPRFVPGKRGKKLQLDNDAHLFLYQLVGTWGQLLFPRPWKEFRLWYDIHKTKGIRPFLEGMVTTGWYKKMGERIWTPWFIKFIHSCGYFNLYTNFQHESALSISHRNAGVNYGKTAGPDSYLLDENSLGPKFFELQPLSKLKWYDFCFRAVLPNRVVRSLDELGPILLSVQKLETIIFVSLYRSSQVVTRNLLCQFERLNIQNYIFIGPKSDFLFDLARRGHPVIDVDQFHYDNSRAQKLTGLGEPSVDLINEIMLKAYAVKKSLELRYNAWLLDGNMLPVSGDMFVIPTDPTYDFHIGKSFELFFARSSYSAAKIWGDDFVHKVAMESSASKVSSSKAGNFIHSVAKTLEKDGAKVKTIDDTSFGMDVDINNVKQSSIRGGQKMVSWSPDQGLDFVQKRLEELGLWGLDADSSCASVVCHQRQ